MKNVNRFTVVAILLALFLTNSVLGDNIPTEGKWRDEYYRPVDVSLPPVASIEGDILSSDSEDVLSNSIVRVMNDRGAKIYEDAASPEVSGTYPFSLAGETSGQYQVVLLRQLGHLTGNFTLK